MISHHFIERKNQSDAYRLAVQVLRDLAESESPDNAHRAAAEAFAGIFQRDWVKYRKVKKSNSPLDRHKLFSKGRSASTFTNLDDHPSIWLRDGKPTIYVSQPYGLGTEALRELVARCDQLGLDATVNAWPAWHFPGSVVFVTMEKAEPREMTDGGA